MRDPGQQGRFDVITLFRWVFEARVRRRSIRGAFSEGVLDLRVDGLQGAAGDDGADVGFGVQGGAEDVEF